MSEISSKIHDIRNPLNSISMNAELGKMVLQNTQDLEKAIQAFNSIIGECQKCSAALAELKESIIDDD